MDKGEAIEIAERFARAVKSKFDFVQVVLFGSYAKGNYHEDSDIDIAVIIKDYTNVMDVQLDLMRLRRTIDSRIEPHPFREKDFEVSNPLVSEILKFGQDIKV